MDGRGMQNAELEWRSGAPVSARFGEAYFSDRDGLAETSHVFLAGNDLPDRFRPGFAIAELGFGTGLNALAAWSCWRRAGIPGDLAFTSFEAWPIAADDMARALAPWPDLAPLAAQLIAEWRSGARDIRLPGLRLRVVEGDARARVPAWTGLADAWFLDGFSPARNPEMWAPDLLEAVAAHTAPGGTCATYSAAGAMRAALVRAGFAVERVAGFGGKRHMTRGRLA